MTRTTPAQHDPPAPEVTGPAHRLSSAILGLALPLAVLAAAGVIAWSWRDALPDPVATH